MFLGIGLGSNLEQYVYPFKNTLFTPKPLLTKKFVVHLNLVKKWKLDLYYKEFTALKKLLCCFLTL